MKRTIYDPKESGTRPGLWAFSGLYLILVIFHTQDSGDLGDRTSSEWRPYVWLAPRLDWCAPSLCCVFFLSGVQRINWRVLRVFWTLPAWEQPPRHAYCPANCCHKFWTQLAGKHSLGKLLYSVAGENGKKGGSCAITKGLLKEFG